MILNPAARRTTLDRQSAELLARGWLIVLLGGAISIVVGILILAIDWSVSSLAFFVGIIFVFEGVVFLGSPPLDSGSRGWTVALGLVSAAAGVAIMVWPEIGLLTLAIFIGAWLVAAGVLNVVGGIGQRQLPYWWLMVALGVIEIALGIGALRRPGLTLALLITLTGIWQIVRGLWQCVLAFELRSLPDRMGPPAAFA